MNKKNIVNSQNKDIFSKPCTILFDTCSILNGDAFTSCMKSIISNRNEKHRIIILSSVIQELRYLANSSTSTCRNEAYRAMNELPVLTKANVLSVIGDSTIAEQADYSILKYVSVHRFNQNIIVVTQDRQLADDISMLNNIKSLPPVYVRKMNYHGNLVSPWDDCHKKESSTNNASDILKRFGIA